MPKPKRITEEIITKWIELYKAGASSVAIAKEFGVSSTCVCNYLDKAGILKKHTAITAEMSKEWIELYRAGKHTSEIAREFGVSQTCVCTYLDQAGVLRKLPNITTKMVKEWIALYKTGNYNCSAIARKYNVMRATVAKYLHMYGVKTSRNVPHLVEER